MSTTDQPTAPPAVSSQPANHSSNRNQERLADARAQARNRRIVDLTGQPAAAFWACLPDGEPTRAVADLIDRLCLDADARAAAERHAVALAVLDLPIHRLRRRALRTLADRIAAAEFTPATPVLELFCGLCGVPLAVDTTDTTCPDCQTVL